MGAGFELTNLDEFLVYLAQSVVGACLMLFLSFGRISIIVKISKKVQVQKVPSTGLFGTKLCRGRFLIFLSFSKKKL